MGRMDDSEDNTPPRSPEMTDNFHLDQADILEVIELDDDGEILAREVFSDDEQMPEELVVVPERDDAVCVFTRHRDSVLSATFHPTRPNIVATGGMDEKIYVWDHSTRGGTTLLATEAKESVDCIKFSHDGKYLAAADVDGVLKIFNGEDFSLITDFELGEDYKWLMWHHSAPVLVAASASLINMYNIPTMECKLLTVCSDGVYCCGKIFPDGKRLVCATTEGTVRIIDMKSGTVQCTVVPKAPPAGTDETIYCLDVHRDGVMVLCGCDMGAIVLLNADTGKYMYFPMVTNDQEDVEVVEYAKAEPYKNMVASAHRSGMLRIWDASRQVLRCTYDCGAPVIGMRWHPSEPTVFTCHTNARALMVDARSGTLLRSFLGHSRMILALELTPDASHLVTVSDDFTARVFSTSEQSPDDVEMA